MGDWSVSHQPHLLPRTFQFRLGLDYHRNPSQFKFFSMGQQTRDRRSSRHVCWPLQCTVSPSHCMVLGPYLLDKWHSAGVLVTTTWLPCLPHCLRAMIVHHHELWWRWADSGTMCPPHTHTTQPRRLTKWELTPHRWWHEEHVGCRDTAWADLFLGWVILVTYITIPSLSKSVSYLTHKHIFCTHFALRHNHWHG